MFFTSISGGYLYDNRKEIKAVEKTIRICKGKILSKYLESRDVEVKGIMHILFEQERINELNRMETAVAAMEALEIHKSDYSKYMAML